MVAYLWNTDRKATFIKIIDAFKVVAAPLESAMQAADPESVPSDDQMPADPEPVPPDMLWSDNYDETQVLTLIRMRSGFEPKMITDGQLLATNEGTLKIHVFFLRHVPDVDMALMHTNSTDYKIKYMLQAAKLNAVHLDKYRRLELYRWLSKRITTRVCIGFLKNLFRFQTEWRYS